MATFLDIGLLSKAELIFAFILIWIVIYGVLLYTKVLGDKNNHLYALIALSVALLTLFTPSAIQVLRNVIPWFALMIVGTVFVLLALMSAGYTMKNVTDTITGKEWSNVITFWIIIMSAIIILGGVGQTFFTTDGTQTVGKSTASTNSGPSDNPIPITGGDVGEQSSDALFATLFHPKVLGLVMVMLIAIFLVQQLGKGSLS